jgi:hypothetical protein
LRDAINIPPIISLSLFLPKGEQSLSIWIAMNDQSSSGDDPQRQRQEAHRHGVPRVPPGQQTLDPHMHGDRGFSHLDLDPDFYETPMSQKNVPRLNKPTPPEEMIPFFGLELRK